MMSVFRVMKLAAKVFKFKPNLIFMNGAVHHLDNQLMSMINEVIKINNQIRSVYNEPIDREREQNISFKKE